MTSFHSLQAPNTYKSTCAHLDLSNLSWHRAPVVFFFFFLRNLLCLCIMGRPPCCNESGVKKGPWTPEEDEKLMDYISKHGRGTWRTLPKHAGLNRCGKSCRLRWENYLRPDIKRGKFTEEEEQLIINLHSVIGNKYASCMCLACLCCDALQIATNFFWCLCVCFLACVAMQINKLKP